MKYQVFMFGLLLISSTAEGAWDQKYSEFGDNKGTALSVSSPDGQYVFVSGFNFAVANPFTDPTHRILRSEDGGEHWRQMSSEGLTGMMLNPVQIFFVDADHGWLLIGSMSGLKVARTANRGAQWTEATAPEGMNQMHFFDAQNGVAVGSDGAIWKTTDSGASWPTVTSPASVNLEYIFFVDRQHGFACGTNTHESGDDTLADEGQVIVTQDGGGTWQLAYETSGQFLSKMYFLDSQRGWMCSGDNSGTPYLLVTQNGGTGWTRQDVPTTSAYMGSVTGLTAVRFFDAQNGRAIGVYDTGMSTSTGGQMYMIADYNTQNGGGTWDLHVNDPGSFGNFNPPEGAMTDARFYSNQLAWAVGTGLRIYKEAPPCQSDADCFEGYICDQGVCRPNTSGPCVTDADCYGDYICRDGTCAEAPPGPCDTDEDCPAGKVCRHGHCVDPGGCNEEAPVGQQGCPFGQICIFGACIQDKTCTTDADCTSTQHCYEGRCYPNELPEFRCLEDSDCAAMEECVDTWCERVETDGGAADGAVDAGGKDAGGGGDESGGDTGGQDAGADASSGTDEEVVDDEPNGGCGCSPAPMGSPAALGAALMFLAWVWRRQR